MALIPPFVHIVETVVYNGTQVTLTVSNSLNVGERDYFVFRCPVTVRDNITGSPVPVFINVNGNANVPLKNRFGLQIMSDKVPTRAYGNYMIERTTTTSEEGGTTTTESPYVILLDSPRSVQNA